MPPPGPILAKDDEVYAPTEKGNRELKSDGTSLSATELQLLVLIDGISSLGEIAESVPSLSREDLTVAVRKLTSGKFVISATEPDSDIMGSGFSTISVPAGFFSSLSDAGTSTQGGVSFLKKKGFFVRIARRPAEQRKVVTGWQPTILVVDDDPDLQKLVRTYLMLEGFKMRMALKRDDILIGLRQQPSPDLFLLDVQLPDTNGFEILAKIRQHPQLKETPVIMLTAETTREGVLRGLQGGADGYVTKPFEPDLLIKAIKTVLGIGAGAAPPKKEEKK